MVNAKLHMMKAWVLISQFSGNVICYNITGKKLMQKKQTYLTKNPLFNSDDAFYRGFQKTLLTIFNNRPFQDYY